MRQPICSIMKALSGQQTVLAKPPNKVRLVMGPRAPRHTCGRARRTPHRKAPCPCRARAPARPRDKRAATAPARCRRAPAAKQSELASSTGRPPWRPMIAADLRRDQPRDQQADRGAADHIAERPAGRPSRSVRKTPPGNRTRCPRPGSGHAERGDDHAAVALRRLSHCGQSPALPWSRVGPRQPTRSCPGGNAWQIGTHACAGAPNWRDFGGFFGGLPGKRKKGADNSGTGPRRICGCEIGLRRKRPFRPLFLSFVLSFITLSHAFLHCCDATILLFPRRDIPMFRATDSPALLAGGRPQETKEELPCLPPLSASSASGAAIARA